MARSVTITVDVNSRGAVQGVRQVEGGMARLDRSAQQAGRGAQRMQRSFDIAIGFIAAQIVTRLIPAMRNAVSTLFEMGTSAQETGNRFNVVFGDMSSEVDDFVRSIANMAGATNNEMRGMVATVGDLFDGMGFLKEETAELSTEVVSFSADLASFMNIPVERAIDATTGAILGQRRQLRDLGVMIRETDVEQRALASSAATTAEELTQQERAMATLELAFERAPAAMGDLERTQEDTMNRMRRLSAEAREQAEVFAQLLLPTFDSLLDSYELITDGSDDVAASLSERLADGVLEASFVLQEMLATLRRLGDEVSIISQQFDSFAGNAGGSWLQDIGAFWQEHLSLLSVVERVTEATLSLEEAWVSAARQFSSGLGMDTSDLDDRAAALQGIRNEIEANAALTEMAADERRQQQEERRGQFEEERQRLREQRQERMSEIEQTREAIRQRRLGVEEVATAEEDAQQRGRRALEEFSTALQRRRDAFRDTIAAATESGNAITAMLHGQGTAMDRLIDRIQEVRRMEDFYQSLLRDASSFNSALMETERVVSQGLNQSVEDVRNAIQIMNAQFEQATGQERRDEIQATIIKLREMMDAMAGEEEKEKADDLNSSFNALTSEAQRFSDTLVGGMLRGQSAADSLSNTLDSVLSQLASSAFSSLLSMAFGGPAVGILGGLFGGGRRFGGSVQGGRLYETHGLGPREFFIPQVSGDVVTAGQMQGGSQRIDVRVSGTLRGDMGELVAEIDEQRTINGL